MTIDEAIECERNHRLYPEYHEQLAEWLELLNWYEQGMKDIPCESGVLPKDVYSAGYIKGIDDFVKEYKSKTTMEHKLVDKLAEQLKAGGENGTDSQ